MLKLFRLSPFRLALSYIALGASVLALFAVPLWLSWQENLTTFRAYVQGADIQGFVETFEREGPEGLAQAIQQSASRNSVDDIVVFADPSGRWLAGNVPIWPAEVPEEGGTYGGGLAAFYGCLAIVLEGRRPKRQQLQQIPRINSKKLESGIASR
jgi:hypothetical protein